MGDLAKSFPANAQDWSHGLTVSESKIRCYINKQHAAKFQIGRLEMRALPFSVLLHKKCIALSERMIVAPAHRPATAWFCCLLGTVGR